MKTHYREVDYRVDWIRDLFSSLNNGFTTIEEKLSNIDYFDGVFAQEQAETIFGIAFVTAQSYIVGTVSDMTAINSKGNVSKLEMLAIGSPIVLDNITKVQLINTIANYYKHYEEWSGWKVERHNKRTIELLNKCGISDKTPYPCHKAAQIIWQTEVLCELDYLLNILIEWRKNLLQDIKNT